MIRSSEVSTLSAQRRHFTLNQASKSFLYRSLSFFASVENPFFAFSFKLLHMRPISCNEQLITCSVQQEERNRRKLQQVGGAGNSRTDVVGGWMRVGGPRVTWLLLPNYYHHRDLLSGSAKRFLITTCRDVLFLKIHNRYSSVHPLRLLIATSASTPIRNRNIHKHSLTFIFYVLRTLRAHSFTYRLITTRAVELERFSIWWVTENFNESDSGLARRLWLFVPQICISITLGNLAALRFNKKWSWLFKMAAAH